MNIPKQCDVFIATSNFLMRVAGQSGRPANVRIGDKFWIKSSIIYNSRGTALISRINGASIFAITLEDLFANFEVVEKV